MLRRALRHVERGFYIDVGAQSPESDSVTKTFSLDGWRGINIEPHPVYFEQLVRLRPDDINLNVALGERPGSLTMNLIEDTGLSTADDEIAARHAAAGYAVKAHEVRMQTLEQVWQRHVPDGQAVHFLKVDVEGFEQFVLAGNDWQRHRPWIVLVEATLPNSQIENHEEWEPVLTSAGYRYVYADGLNRFYVAEERAELVSAFRYPPNVFDGFIMSSFEHVQQDCSRLGLELNAVREHASNLLQQVHALNESLQESHQRIQRAESDLALVREREMALHERLRAERSVLQYEIAQRDAAIHSLQDRLDAERSVLQHEIAQRDAAIHSLQDRLDAERTTLQHEIDRRDQSLFRAEQRAHLVEQQRDAVLQSPWWRMTGPGRAVMGVAPKSLRRQIRRWAKAVWWAATPWRIPSRLRLVRERQRAAAQVEGGAVEALELNLYPDRTPGRPPVPPIEALERDLTDRTLAARWCMCLLRSQPEVRARFPRALSQPEADGFIAWVQGEGGERFGLSVSARSLVVGVLEDDFGRRARQYYLARPDMRALHPNGLNPAGHGVLYRWFSQFGCSEGKLSAEEVLWLFMQASETPGQESHGQAMSGRSLA
ncbi:FkbM family methyltransferase [Variovorax sp. dw_308]|uniref:FkbM family methyltransferase n=1 Tax=Variovorax sp. dw_308 TaxID=2721546 RepID=UPI001C43DB1C|nr:FkbM family methyltransferase [Variovorax sp. dw_308]